MSNSAIRDNHSNGAVGDFLKQAITKDSEISIVSAYFTIYAYHHLKSNLDSINNLRFLFGEPTFIKTMDPDKTNVRDFKIEDDKIVIPLESRLSQKAVAKECSEWIKTKTEIRSMVKPNFLHGKMYHIHQESGIEKAIAGSSNFTVNGLGLGGSRNIELNLVIDSDRDRQELKEWFDSIWNDQTGLVEDVKKQALKYLEQLYVENEPEFIYFKTLFHIFENYLDEQKRGGLLNERTGFFESEIWNILYDFQKDGVKGAINKILKHNGCIIADSVGLGKTYEALAIIKYFELLNNRVLVVCPKKLTGNWTIYQASQKTGASALGLQQVLGLGSYYTAWTWLHKLRRAMVRPGRDRISGVVEVDESYIEGKKSGKRGRGASGKALVVIVAQIEGTHIGRIRLRWVPDASAKSLEDTIREGVEPGSTVHTDGWKGVRWLEPYRLHS